MTLPVHVSSEAVAELPPVAEAAGGMATELLVVVTAQAGFEAVRAEVAPVRDEQAGVVARVDRESGAAGDPVAHPVDAGAEQLVLADGEVALHRGRVAAGVEGAGERTRAGGVVEEVALGLIVGAADADADVGALVRAQVVAIVVALVWIFVIENLFASDLAFLQDLYRRINAEGHTRAAVTCPECSHRFTLDLSGGRLGES